MVASAHPLATEAGLTVLAKGGNAVDAAVAVSFALSVVEPWSSGLGGGGFAVVSIGGTVTTFDMRETAPRAASTDMFVENGQVIAGESTATARAAGIPGLVKGMAALHAKFGKLPFEEVVAPAVALARDGFPVSVRLQAAIASMAERFKGDARRIFLPGEKVPAVGDRLFQKDLADTLERIARSKGEDFYVGKTARELVRAVRELGGIWNEDDLFKYKIAEREPVRGSYRGHDVISMGPPSSGGLLLVQMLSVLEALPKTAARTGERAHVLAEVMKRAFAMRAIGLADPDFVPVDHSRFIGADAVKKLAADVKKAKKATPAKALSTLQVKADRPDTSHFAVLTANGDGVAVTQTINLRFGNGQVAGATGVVLNNEMDDFAVQVGVPNAFGLVGDEGNAVAPGKRPLSSMTPTLVLKDGKVVGAFGSPGGSRIISTTLQVLVHMLDDGYNVAEAVGSPRIHHQWFPDRLDVERQALSPEARSSLEKRGHAMNEVSPMGNAMAIWRRADGRIEGAADPRGEGQARGR
jgi:gamma-glutamyltranspeptidase/glutathione hydrolase